MASRKCFHLYILMLVPMIYAGDQDYCMWGRTDPSHYNTILNGQYVNDGNTNQKPSYKKVTNENCSKGTSKSTLYLYWSSGFALWGIGNAKNTNSWYAYCLFPDLSSCTEGTWQMAGGNEPNLFAKSGDCPSWDCDSVTSTITESLACRNFDIKIGPNAYQNSATGYVWTFNPTFFRWLCINGNDYNYRCSSAPYSASVQHGWRDLSAPFSLVFNYTFPVVTEKVSCIGSSVHTTDPPSKSPSDTPAQHLTNNPTNHPTNIPSFRPSSIPTVSPSYNPTRKSTKNPSNSPSNIPSFVPSNHPSSTPSNIPSIPSSTPTASLPITSTTTLTTSTSISTRAPSGFPSFNSTSMATLHPTSRPINNLIIPTNQPSSTPISSNQMMITRQYTITVDIVFCDISIEECKTVKCAVNTQSLEMMILNTFHQHNAQLMEATKIICNQVILQISTQTDPSLSDNQIIEEYEHKLEAALLNDDNFENVNIERKNDPVTESSTNQSDDNSSVYQLIGIIAGLIFMIGLAFCCYFIAIQRAQKRLIKSQTAQLAEINKDYHKREDAMSVASTSPQSANNNMMNEGSPVAIDLNAKRDTLEIAMPNIPKSPPEQGQQEVEVESPDDDIYSNPMQSMDISSIRNNTIRSQLTQYNDDEKHMVMSDYSSYFGDEDGNNVTAGGQFPQRLELGNFTSTPDGDLNELKAAYATNKDKYNAMNSMGSMNNYVLSTPVQPLSQYSGMQSNSSFSSESSAVHSGYNQNAFDANGLGMPTSQIFYADDDDDEVLSTPDGNLAFGSFVNNYKQGNNNGMVLVTPNRMSYPKAMKENDDMVLVTPSKISVIGLKEPNNGQAVLVTPNDLAVIDDINNMEYDATVDSVGKEPAKRHTNKNDEGAAETGYQYQD